MPGSGEDDSVEDPVPLRRLAWGEDAVVGGVTEDVRGRKYEWALGGLQERRFRGGILGLGSLLLDVLLCARNRRDVVDVLGERGRMRRLVHPVHIGDGVKRVRGMQR